MVKQVIGIGAAPDDGTGDHARLAFTKVNSNFTELYDAEALNTAKVTNATHTGEVTGATALTITDKAVTLAKIADIATARIMGRVTAGAGSMEELTAAQVRAALNIEDGAAADLTGAEIKVLYEALANTNEFNDAEKTKLGTVATNADVSPVTSVAALVGAITAAGLRTAINVADGAEVNAVNSVAALTGVITAAALRTALNVADGADVSPVASVAALTGAITAAALRTALNVADGAEVNVVDSVNSLTGTVVLDPDDLDDTSTANKFVTAAEISKIAAAATLTGAETLTNKTLTDPKTNVTENPQSGTAYTLALTDASKLVTRSNATTDTTTIPANATVAFPVGTCIVVQLTGAGVGTIVGATGVTLNGVSAGSGTIGAQWGAVALYKQATNTWLAFGDIGAVA